MEIRQLPGQKKMVFPAIFVQIDRPFTGMRLFMDEGTLLRLLPNQDLQEEETTASKDSILRKQPMEKRSVFSKCFFHRFFLV